MNNEQDSNQKGENELGRMSSKRKEGLKSECGSKRERERGAREKVRKEEKGWEEVEENNK